MTEIKYHLNGNKIIAMETGDERIHFIYDQDGNVFSMRYQKGSQAVRDYYYLFNNQGDIIGLLDSSGNLITKYEYNSQGELTGIFDYTRDGYGHKNPFRYRGYFYDDETGFYYVTSRYYDPVIMRFINADGQISTGGDLLGANIYIYCGNNPVSRIDSNGTAWKKIKRLFSSAKAKAKAVVKAALRAVKRTASNILKKVSRAYKTFNKKVYNYVYNTDEKKVLNAKGLSFYKGTPVIKAPIGENAASYGIIILGDEVSGEWGERTVKHEYGHRVQLEEIGIVKYTMAVAIPSVVGNVLDRAGLNPMYYYDQPWEYMADMYGGVDRGRYSEWADDVSKIYWDMLR